MRSVIAALGKTAHKTTSVRQWERYVAVTVGNFPALWESFASRRRARAKLDTHMRK